VTRAPASRRPAAAAPRVADIDDAEEAEDLAAIAPRAPRSNPFGSVWDSQIGTPASGAGVPRAPLVDEEDFEEPEIPEYLIAEQRRSGNRGGAPGRGGPRGGRSAYQSAMERERYGRGSSGGGGINRYPDVSGRTRSAPPPREDRNYSRGGDRPAPAPAARTSSEPWSDVPPELEALLRAQVAQKPATGRPAPRSAESPAGDDASVAADVSAAPVDAQEPAPAAPARPRAARKTSTSTSATAGEGKAPAKPRAPRKTAASSASASTSSSAGDAAASGDPGVEPAAKAPAKPRAPRKTSAAKAAADPATTDDGATAPPKRRAPRKTTAPAEPV
jgi:hypothetical protein